MSPKALSPEARREVIKEHIFTHTYPQIAKLCGCAKRTIRRDVKLWKQEGGFDELLMEEFFKSYPQVKVTNPDKAFDRLVYLLGKHVTQHVESKTEHSGTLNIKGDIEKLIKFSRDENDEG